MSSSDFGKDLYGVQRLIRNHEQLEDELVTHETTLRVRIEHSRQLFFSIISTILYPTATPVQRRGTCNGRTLCPARDPSQMLAVGGALARAGHAFSCQVKAI